MTQAHAQTHAHTRARAHTHTHTPLRLTHHMMCRLTCYKKYKREKIRCFPLWSKALGDRLFEPSVAFKWFSTWKRCFTGCMWTCVFVLWMFSIHSTHKIPLSITNVFIKFWLLYRRDFYSDPLQHFVTEFPVHAWWHLLIKHTKPADKLGTTRKPQLRLAGSRRVPTCVSTRCIFISTECRQCHNRRDGSLLELLQT